MQKTISLKELHRSFIASGMTISELCAYLNVSEELIVEWERFFNIFPENGEQKIYSEKRIRDFIKIKDSIDRGLPLHEIRRKLFKIDAEPVKAVEEKILEPVILLPALVENPFEKAEKVMEFKREVIEQPPSVSEESLIKPFLTQINKANERIGELILEKAKLVEDTAIEKAGLMSEIKTLKSKNIELLTERENLFVTIKEKEQQIRESRVQESTLAEALKNSQEILKQKEEEISFVKTKIEAYEQELRDKEGLIFNQSMEINKLLEKQNRKWWHFLRDIFF